MKTMITIHFCVKGQEIGMHVNNDLHLLTHNDILLKLGKNIVDLFAFYKVATYRGNDYAKY